MWKRVFAIYRGVYTLLVLRYVEKGSQLCSPCLRITEKKMFISKACFGFKSFSALRFKHLSLYNVNQATFYEGYRLLQFFQIGSK